MEIIDNIALNEDVKTQLYELWNNEYPKALQFKDFSSFDSYLEGLVKPKHFYVVNESGIVVGWFFCFERDNEKWFGLIVSHNYQNQGIGKKLLLKAQSQFHTLNGWVVKDNIYKLHNEKTYKSPLDFYLNNGFEIMPNKYLRTDKINTIMVQWKRG